MDKQTDPKRPLLVVLIDCKPKWDEDLLPPLAPQLLQQVIFFCLWPELGISTEASRPLGFSKFYQHVNGPFISIHLQFFCVSLLPFSCELHLPPKQWTKERVVIAAPEQTILWPTTRPLCFGLPSDQHSQVHLSFYPYFLLTTHHFRPSQMLKASVKDGM